MPNEDVLRVADLPQNSPTRFKLRPAAPVLSQIAMELDLLDLRKLEFSGQLAAQGRKDWRLTAKLGATVVQPCIVTLEPVTTRIDIPVNRLFLADWHEPEASEVEMPEDDETEPLPTELDMQRIMREALALALPLYPRSQSAETGEMVFTEPGKAALTDEDVKPFAGLAELRDALKKDQ
ncbi:YceD family protein [Ruegeria hyattellae]|uniref:YceD family protein n=1 Tax=Ruegeria hyattellae TaxID=3233337 RepID=UPI00355AD82E